MTKPNNEWSIFVHSPLKNTSHGSNLSFSLSFSYFFFPISSCGVYHVCYCGANYLYIALLSVLVVARSCRWISNNIRGFLYGCPPLRQVKKIRPRVAKLNNFVILTIQYNFVPKLLLSSNSGYSFHVSISPGISFCLSLLFFFLKISMISPSSLFHLLIFLFLNFNRFFLPKN